MIHRISRIENRVDSDDELLIECFGDVEIYLTREQFAEIAAAFAARTQDNGGR